jgi:EAL domain-containing protein (putative c-di-GMP-specific phosphodiesterase class I)
VETPAQAEALRALQCQRGQGYLFSKPLPAEEAAQLLAGGRSVRGRRRGRSL